MSDTATQGSAPTPSKTSGAEQGSKTKPAKRTGRVLSQLRSWIAASEPSAQAFKQHQKASYSKVGISLDDPAARTKLQAPVGSIPEGAIKPSGKGPDPEDVARRKAERDRALRQACADVSGTSRSGASRTSRSFSSHSSLSSGSSVSAAERSSALSKAGTGG